MHLSSSNFTLFKFIFEVQNDKYGTFYLNESVVLYVEVLLIKWCYTKMSSQGYGFSSGDVRVGL